VLNNHHRGVSQSNIDEYWSGVCDRCDNNIYWEPNYEVYDRTIRQVHKKNIIVIGDYINTKPARGGESELSKKMLEEILCTSKMFIIQAPPLSEASIGHKGWLTKRKLQQYIFDQLKPLV
jgi:hypothetical protein